MKLSQLFKALAASSISSLSAAGLAQAEQLKVLSSFSIIGYGEKCRW